jgi:WD40 repeat protein
MLKKLISCSINSSCKIWQSAYPFQLIKTIQSIQPFKGNSYFVNDMIEQPNTNLVSGNSDGTINIWNSTNMSIISTLYEHVGYVYITKFEYSGGKDSIIKIWQSESPYECLASLYGHTSFLNALAILPNSNIVSGSRDSIIKIWKSQSPYILIATLIGHSDSVNALEILPNSNLVSGSRNSTTKIWNSTTFELIATLYDTPTTTRLPTTTSSLPINNNLFCNVSLSLRFSSPQSDLIDLNSDKTQALIDNFNAYVMYYFKFDL